VPWPLGVYRGPPEVYRGPCMKNMRQNEQLQSTYVAYKSRPPEIGGARCPVSGCWPSCMIIRWVKRLALVSGTNLPSSYLYTRHGVLRARLTTTVFWRLPCLRFTCTIWRHCGWLRDRFTGVITLPEVRDFTSFVLSRVRVISLMCVFSGTFQYTRPSVVHCLLCISSSVASIMFYCRLSHSAT